MVVVVELSVLLKIWSGMDIHMHTHTLRTNIYTHACRRRCTRNRIYTVHICFLLERLKTSVADCEMDVET